MRDLIVFMLFWLTIFVYLDLSLKISFFNIKLKILLDEDYNFPKDIDILDKNNTFQIFKTLSQQVYLGIGVHCSFGIYHHALSISFG
jgi:hypothetical protein